MWSCVGASPSYRADRSFILRICKFGLFGSAFIANPDRISVIRHHNSNHKIALLGLFKTNTEQGWPERNLDIEFAVKTVSLQG